eukprot:scaffold4110_cov77-Skeletonema_dohrnii-CCMP3373.AAC.8
MIIVCVACESCLTRLGGRKSVGPLTSLNASEEKLLRRACQECKSTTEAHHNTIAFADYHMHQRVDERLQGIIR